MSSQRIIVIAVIAAALVLGLGYILGGERTARAPVTEPEDLSTAAPASEDVEVEQTPPRPHISRDTVENMYYGASYEAIEEMFGIPSDASETEYNQGVEGYTSPFLIQWHVWQNEDGTNVRLGFINNRMDRKQFIAPDGSDQLPEAPHADAENYGRILGINE